MSLITRVANVWRSRRLDTEFDQELEFHIAMRTDKNIRHGMAPADAIAEAQRHLGSRLRAREGMREARSVRWVGEFAADAQSAMRSFARTKLFTVAAVVTLALGIGANTAVFSVVEAVMLRPLPYPDAPRMIRVVEHAPILEGGRAITQPVTTAELLELRRHSRTLAFIDGYGTSAEMRFGDTEYAEVAGARVSRELLMRVAGRASVGRLFDEHESASSAPVVVISHDVWRRHFGSDPSVLGRTVTIEGLTQAGLPRQTFTIIGVMERGFQFPSPGTGFWIPYPPLNALPASLRSPNVGWIRAGVSVDTASQEVAALLRSAPTPVDSRFRFEAVELQEEQIAPVRPALRLSMLCVTLVLILACANVANLQLARMAGRTREVVLRHALGASRWRLLRQMLAESLVLSAMGGVGGVLVAFAGLRLLRPLLVDFSAQSGLFRRGMFRQAGVDPIQVGALPAADEIALNGTALLFTAGVCLFASLLFGAAPLLHVFRRQHMNALREGAASAPGGFGLFRRHAGRSVLVVAQIALAATLLIGTGLAVNSYLRLVFVDNGYQPGNAFAFEVRVPPRHFTPQSHGRFSRELSSRLEQLPGVVAAGYATFLPGRHAGFTIQVRRADQPERLATSPRLLRVSRNFLAAMGTRVVAGRGFGGQLAHGRREVLINQDFARRRFEGDNPVGRVVYLDFAEFDASMRLVPWTIVGVVADVRQDGPDTPPGPQLYMNLDEPVRREANPRETSGLVMSHVYVVRTDGNQADVLARVRAEARRLVAAAVLDNVTPLDQLAPAMIARPRMYAGLLAAFGLIALVVAANGIYGVMAYVVSQATREIGLRLALGANRRDVFALVLSRAGAVTMAGLALGLVGAVAISGLLQGLIFGLTALDAATYAVVVGLFAVIAIGASCGPARRATLVHPATALRAE
jgi:putative ABC transport system permease protein